MKDFSSYDYTNGSFPDVEATNSSGGTLRDGTPIEADTLNDVWGAFQAILDKADVTPSGSAESSSASDLLTSLWRVAGHPGEIVFWGGHIKASGTEFAVAEEGSSERINLLLLAGQVISRTTYADLVAAVENSSIYHDSLGGFMRCSASGIYSASGDYMKLPDARGYFLRSLDNGSGNDPGRASTSQAVTPGGAVQGQCVSEHYHKVGMNTLTPYVPNQVFQMDAAIAWGTLYDDVSTVWGGADLENPPLGEDYGFWSVNPGSGYSPVFVTGTSLVQMTTASGDGQLETKYPEDLPIVGKEEVRPPNIAFHLCVRF